MADRHQFEQQTRSSLGLVLTDASADAASGSGAALGYELRTEDGDPIDALVSDQAETGQPIGTASCIVLQVVLPPEEFAGGVVIVQPRRIA
jgi:hypothetical protein